MKPIFTMLRQYLVTGLLTLLPITVTTWLLLRLFHILDAWSVNITTQFLGKRIPGIGVAVTLAVLVVTGAVTTNVLGRRMFSSMEKALTRVPVVRSIYSAARQLVDTFASPQKAAFKKVVLVEYPRSGVWSLAFVTSERSPLLSQAVGQQLVTVFIATTPNPTSGFFLGVPEDECIPLNVSVEDAFKLIISGGAIEPTVLPDRLARVAETG